MNNTFTKLNSNIKDNFGIIVLTILFSLLIASRFVIFFNDYSNDYFTSNIDKYDHIEDRIGVYFYVIIVIELITSALSFWIFQSMLIILTLPIFYKTITLFLDKETALLASLLYIISPYNINLIKDTHFILPLFVFSLSNLFLVKFLKGDEKSFIKYIITTFIGLFFNIFYLFGVVPQIIALFFFNKKKASYITAFLTFLYQTLQTLTVRLILGFSSSRILKFQEFLPNYSSIYSFLQHQKVIFVRSMFLYNIIFSFFYVILFINVKKILNFSIKNHKIRFVSVNFVISLFLIILASLYMEDYGIIYPGTKYFIFLSYWLVTLVAVYVKRISKTRLTFFILLIILFSSLIIYGKETIDYTKKYNAGKEYGKVFDTIYKNYDKDYILIHSDIVKTPAHVWIPLSRYSFSNLFLLKGVPERNNSVLLKEMRKEYPSWMNPSVNWSTAWMIANNHYEYDGFYIVSNNAMLTPASRINFTYDLINSLKTQNQKFILILKCCKNDRYLELVEELEEYIIANTTVYVYDG